MQQTLTEKGAKLLKVAISLYGPLKGRIFLNRLFKENKVSGIYTDFKALKKERVKRR